MTCRLHNWSIGHFLPHRHLPPHIDGNRCVDGDGDEREEGVNKVMHDKHLVLLLIADLEQSLLDTSYC